jgi:hypothetical protein
MAGAVQIPKFIYLFSLQIPEPVSWCISSWSEEYDAGMSYTYLPVGVRPDTMDTLSEPVEGKVYFAGEVRETFSS